MRLAPFTPRAQRELSAAGRWIARDNKKAAIALRDTVREAGLLIASYPYCGRADESIVRAPYRLLVLRGFPYILVYNPEPQRLSIVRIVHGARDLPEVLSDF